MRERMGSGGPRGLQILMSGACSVRGGFDSHAFPPSLGACAIALLIAAGLMGSAFSASAAGALAENASAADSVARPLRDTLIIIPSPEPSSARVRVDSLATGALVDTSGRSRARRTARDTLRGFDTPRWVMLRSLVFPAWGQLHNHAWWKAASIGGTESYLIGRLVDDRRALDRLNADIDASRAAKDAALEATLVDAYNARSDRYVGRQWWLGALLA